MVRDLPPRPPGPHYDPTASGVRYLGPTVPPKGNVFVVCIVQPKSKPLRLNPCSYALAMGFAVRWNQRTNSDAASVEFIDYLGTSTANTKEQ